MRKLHFTVERGIHGGVADAAYLAEGDEVVETLHDAMWSAVCLSVEVTIGGVTMPACMWEDPEHWAEDWATKLEVDYGDAVEAVAAILAANIAEEAPSSDQVTFIVTTANGERTWLANDAAHAREQHAEAFDGHEGEDILSVRRSQVGANVPAVATAAWIEFVCEQGCGRSSAEGCEQPDCPGGRNVSVITTESAPDT